MSHPQPWLGRAVPCVVTVGDGSTTGCEVVRSASAYLHQETGQVGNQQSGIERKNVTPFLVSIKFCAFNLLFAFIIALCGPHRRL